MLSFEQRRFRRHASFLRQQFLQDARSPFGDVLSEEIVARAMAAIGGCWVDRIYSPLVTLWVFLIQVLSSDHSCRAAVARLNVHRLAQGKRPCSSETGAYCQARKRLPEAFFSTIVRQSAAALESKVDPNWRWKGRRVYTFDGSTVAMADTPENQQAYPQNPSQKPGLGFPIARIAAVFSLACGAVIDLGICRYAGKGQSEAALLRTLWHLFCAGDVLLGDRLMCSWTEIVMLKARGIDVICRFTSHRTTDFRRGKRLGPGDHIVTWNKPQRPRSLDDATYDALPDALTIRECRIQVPQPGFRSKSIVIATTLTDIELYSKDDLAELYRALWSVELDLRSLKDTLQMDTLRCKTPELVRKEIWTHLLAYNLIRTIAAQAAARHRIEPRSISFKGTVQTLAAFQPLIDLQTHQNAPFRKYLYERLLDAVAGHRVANRPDRYEPRLRKRRNKKYDLLMKPRHEMKRLMAKHFKAN